MPPDDLRCAALTSTSLQVSWQPPPVNHQNGLLQGYKISFEPMADDNTNDNDDIENRKTTALTTVLTSLRKFSNYSIQVLAYTRMGDGVMSQPIFCHTEEDGKWSRCSVCTISHYVSTFTAPEAPADIKVVVSSSNSLYISWIEPKEPNGVITKYNLYTRQVNGREELNNDKRNLPSQQTHYEAKGLQPHQEYQFWVTASTRVGEGKSSRVASQITSSRVAARIISFGGPIIRPWKLSTSLYCLAVGQPRREWYKNDISLKSIAFYSGQVLDSGELIISNLQIADSGNYSCQVDNGIGTDRLTYNLMVQVPPSPPVLYVTSATSSSILMHWKNTGNGNAPITAYTLHYKRAHGNIEEMHLSRHASSHELKDLKCGSTYNIYLTSHNKIGPSLASTTLHVRTQGEKAKVWKSRQLKLFRTQVKHRVCRSHFSWFRQTPLQFCFGWTIGLTTDAPFCTLLFNTERYRTRVKTRGHWCRMLWNLSDASRLPAWGLRCFINWKWKLTTLPAPRTLISRLSRWQKTEVGVYCSPLHWGFAEISISTDPPPAGMENRINRNKFFLNEKIIITAIITVTIVICSSALMIICLKLRKCMDCPSFAPTVTHILTGQRKQHRKEINENLKKAEIQRDRYYATIHKVALHGDKIPGKGLITTNIHHRKL